jgi:GPN-loop GTPase
MPLTEILEKRSESLDYIFVDTPGQIEVFTWSAGGQIILELLASSFPTTILYLSDTTRCTSPTTFMSNMLYACSVLFKSRLPIVSVFNKIDTVSCAFALEWMADFESYLNAIESDGAESGGGGGGGDGEYMGSLNRSLALVMDEFYR